MVSKNNNIKKVEQVADRQPSFGIRKLTVGAVSVLLGTTLWLGNNANIAKADTNSADSNQESQDSATKAANSTQAKKAVVIAQVTVDNDKSQTEANNSSQQATQASSNNTQVAVDKTNSDNSEKTDAKQIQSSKQDSNQNIAINESASKKESENKSSEVTSQNAQVQLQKAVTNTAQKQVEQKANEAIADQKIESSKIQQAAKNGQNGNNKSKSEVDIASAALKGVQKSDLTNDNKLNLNDAQKAAKTEKSNETNEFNPTQITALMAANTDLNKELGASLVNWGSSDTATLDGLVKEGNALINNVNAQVAEKVDTSKFKTVTNGNDLVSAINSWDTNIQGVNVQGNINLTGAVWGNTLTVNKNFYINGLDNASINLGQVSLNNNANLTLANVTVNGSIKGNGSVIVKGDVTSNVDYSNNATLSDSELKTQIGNSHPKDVGVNTNNWKAANIAASRVVIDPEASLTVNRNIDGDGIVLMNGGALFGQNVGTNGALVANYNSKLTINLKDWQNASRANEQATNIENANTGIRAVNNGHVVTGDSAEININAGHGRAIIFNEPFGGNGSIHQKSNLETNWYNDRSITRDFNYAMDTNNSVIFGDSNKVHVTGRDGILFGNRGNFVTGEHSIIRIDSKGNGAGLLGDAFSNVEVSPQSQLLLTSDGKNASGQWSGGNFIGLGENGQFRVEHDATFRYKMINRGGNDGNYYDDNMNIISTNPQSHPEVYVGPNATFDGQSDYSNYYGEIFSFPLGSTNTVFQIDGSKYVNWERNAVSTKPGPNGNLYYSMGKSLIDATSAEKGRSYYVFKWYNQYFNGQDLTFNDENSDAVKQSLQGFIDTSSEYWKNVTHLATSYSKNGNTAEFPGHFVTGIDMNGDATPGQKHGTPLNDFSGGNDGFDPHSSQRLVLVATIIPVQEDKTEQVKTPFKIQVHENKDLKPGEVKLVQQGQDGIVRKTTTTYYNVDPSSGKKTLDTSQGTNGVKTTTTVISKEQDEIIDIGPQTAYVKYLYQNNDTNQTDPIQVDGQNLQAAISAIPVETDSQGNIVFTENGDVTANTIDYSDVQDLQKGKEAVSQSQKINIDDVQVLENQWQQAVKDKTNKYNVTGLTRESIIEAAEKAGLNNPVVVGPTEGPVFKVILGNKIQDQTAQVIYRDVQDPESPVQLATSGELSGKPGTPINYSTSDEISNLENKGYVLTKDGYPKNAKFTDKAETYYVDFVHSAVPVTPNTPPTDVPKTPDGKQLVDPSSLTKNVTLTVDYVNNNGSKFTGEIPNDAKQTITFTGSAYIDRVTGQIVNAKKDGDNWVANGAGKVTWTPESSSFKAVISPTETNYHIVNVSDYKDGNNVAAIPDITKDSKDIKVTVTYAPDGQNVINQKTIPSTQTVKFLEEGTDKQLLDPNKQSFTFTYSGDTINSETKEVIKKGSWNAETHTYDTVNVPVIDGYVAIKGYVTKDGKVVAGGLTATQSDPDVQAIVYYAKVGKIVPVDPGHTPIPDTPTPTYKNDPDNPTKVVPNEPVPEVPGYTPEVPSVTPEDPTKDTPVVYNKDAQEVSGQVVYIDDTDDKTLKTADFKGKVGQKIDYTTAPSIKQYEDEGYVLVSNDFKDGDEVYKSTGNDFQVHLKHGTVPVNPENPGKPDEPINPNDPTGPKYPADTEKSALTKTIIRTINYVDNSGKVISKPVTQTVDFTKSGVLDKVTGKWITPLTWDPTSKEISEVTSPKIPDYHVISVSKDKDGDNVKAVTITPSETSYDVTVTYAPDGQNVINQKSIPSTQTVKFLEEGTDKQLLDPNKQSFTFTYSGDTINSETKEVIKKGSWNAETHTYDTVNVPVIDGYVAIKGYVTKDGKVVAGGLTATQSDPDVQAIVYYAKVGKIVPVDPGHTPIPDTPTPTYKNDPDNPTKVVPNEPVPEVPGYTPEVPNVTPEDSTKDTPVVYNKNVQDQTAEVIYQDINDPSKPVQLATSGKLTGKAGNKIDYSTTDEIKILTDKGYVLVKNGFPTDATYQDTNKVQTYYVTFKHGTVPVNPENPGKPDEPINPNDPTGPKYPADTEKSALTKTITRTINYVDNSGKVISKPVTQTVDFTRSGVLDKVTGKWITPLTWNPTSKEISEVTSPTVPDYHIVSVSKDKDGNNVKAVTITPSETSYDVTVTYAPDGQSVINQKSIPSKQTIKFVDIDGKELSPDKVSDFTFTYSGDTINSETKEVIKKGSWNAETHTYDTVNVPVIDGYVAIKGYTNKDGNIVAGGLTATQDKPDVEAVVVYAKIGKIVPVDPGHTPIPDTPTPTYKNDPDNPTKVVPNEPVPEVPGYTPEVPNVTPEDPTKDTQVVYKKNPEVQDQTAEIIYQDVNDPNDIIQLATSGILTGKAGTRIDYSTKDEIAKLTNEGYVLVTNGFPSNATYDDKKNIVQKFYVTFKHGTVPVNPENPGKPGEPINPNDPNGPKYPEDSNVVNKTVTRTIEFVNEKGQPVAKDIKQSVKFTASGVLDKVTGKWITPLTWSPNQEISEEKVPFVENYHVVSINKDADGKIAVKAVTLTHDDTSYTVKVTYAPNGHIVPVDPEGNKIPNAPTPQYPTSPNNPADVTPNEPVPEVPGYTPTVPTVTPQNPGKDTPVIYTPIDDMEHAIVIYQDVNNPNHPVQLASSGDLAGKAGTVINYSTKEEITKLTDRGYVLKNDDFTSGVKFDNDKNKVQTFYVNFVHGTVPVNPDNPGKPGEPINPEDPNGPKYPAGSNIVSRDVTRTIDYVDQNGKEMPGHSPIVQTAHFTGSGVLDKVTGQWITPITWSGDGDLAGETSPVISGFHIVRVSQDSTNNINVDPTVVKYNTDSYKVSVIYAPNGHIVPVDPEGNKIPNAPTPQYPTSPDNPADVTPNEPVPTIPGFTPETPTITPQNPGTNTPVIYTPDAKMQTAIVNYVDSDDHDAIIATSGDITGKPGTVIDYSTKKELTILSDKGYVLVHNGFDPDGVSPKFDSDSSTVQTYTVVLKHGIVTVTPNNPGHPGEPINPNDPNGPKWPTDTGKDNLEKVATQTIRYVGAGDNTPKDNVQKFTFTKKIVIDKVTGKIIENGAWNDTSHTFGSIDTPVVEGYHADKRVAGGTIVTPTDLNKTVTVVYTKNGKIIPVNPDGTPIPNASTPTYKTDPTDPTKVVPDEPVPTVPNMIPSQKTVTPQNPGKDTPVVYNNQQGSVVVVVHDITTNTNLPQYGYNSKTVAEGTKVDYDWTKTKQELENHGYEIVSQNISIPTVVGKTAQTITIDVKHATAPVGPDNPHEPGTPINPNYPDGPKWPAKDTYTKHYTSTIHFVDSEGKALEKDSVQTSTWTRTIIVDKVTGKILNDNESWKPNITTYAPTTVPVIKGYVAEKKSKDGITVGATLPGSKVVQKDIQDSIIYNKIGKIVPVDPSGNPIPGAATPEYKNDPTNPTAVVPNEPVPNIPGYTPEEKTVTPVDPTKDTKVVYTKPSTPVTPVTPDVPATPDNPTSPVTPSPAPHPQTPPTPEPTPEPEAVKPHPQTVPTKPQQPQVPQKETTVKPHPQTVKTEPVATPTAEKVVEKKMVSNPTAIQHTAPVKAQTVVKESQPSSPAKPSSVQRTLPQTGESDNAEAATILGAAAAGLSMIGLAGVKKRRKK
ncbi:mucin-binding protein [Lactobacillus sp. PSON]|uniref:mucin-binding protein n=1 Tax=Lactobacillus sp. PSON TaxID=3455454 RepID=UPI004042564E